ncbi:MAG: sensor histidine kinase, partial [Ramlibacter sp.]
GAVRYRTDRLRIGAHRRCMLHDFLSANREALIERCRRKVAQRRAPAATESELQFGIPLFLDQLIRTLRAEQRGDADPVAAELENAATRHGRELLRHGFAVDQVVHDYGDLCQAITNLAIETEAPIHVNEFRTLNRCLDNGIADAVTEFTRERETLIAGRSVQTLNEKLGMLAHELRNQVTNATLALSVIREGNVGLSGATGAVLDRALASLHTLIDRSLADVRVTAGMPVRQTLVSISDFIAEVQVAASLQARASACEFTATVSGDDLAVMADTDMLLAAVGNLLQNAFKFTRPHSKVTLRAYAQGDRLLIDVQDQCGGLPAGSVEVMFKPFVQTGLDKSGMGLGLSICKQGVEANGGRLSVRNLPGSGCVFSIDLPLHSFRQAGPSPAVQQTAGGHHVPVSCQQS